MLLDLYFSNHKHYPLGETDNLKQILMDFEHITNINTARGDVIRYEQKLQGFCRVVAKSNFRLNLKYSAVKKVLYGLLVVIVSAFLIA